MMKPVFFLEMLVEILGCVACRRVRLDASADEWMCGGESCHGLVGSRAFA